MLCSHKSLPTHIIIQHTQNGIQTAYPERNLARDPSYRSCHYQPLKPATCLSTRPLAHLDPPRTSAPNPTPTASPPTPQPSHHHLLPTPSSLPPSPTPSSSSPQTPKQPRPDPAPPPALSPLLTPPLQPRPPPVPNLRRRHRVRPLRVHALTHAREPVAVRGVLGQGRAVLEVGAGWRGEVEGRTRWGGVAQRAAVRYLGERLTGRGRGGGSRTAAYARSENFLGRSPRVVRQPRGGIHFCCGV